MALQTKGFSLDLVLVDNGGNRSGMRFDLNSADFTEATADATSIVNAVEGVTDALIRSYRLAEVFEEDTELYGDGEVENVASISARIDNAEVKFATLRIPAPSDGIFQAAEGPLYNVVDPADAALVAFLALYATGGVAFTSDGETLLSPGTAGNVTGKRIHRKSRKG